jgi:hypothetical protein
MVRDSVQDHWMPALLGAFAGEWGSPFLSVIEWQDRSTNEPWIMRHRVERIYESPPHLRRSKDRTRRRLLWWGIQADRVTQNG